jgi:hypothetical protein
MVGKLIGLVLLVGIGVGIYFIGRSVEGESNVVATVAALPDRAAITVAEANLQTAAQAASTYFSEHGTYAGMTLVGASVKRADATSYCLENVVRTSVAHLAGPGGTAAAGPCT